MNQPHKMFEIIYFNFVVVKVHRILRDSSTFSLPSYKNQIVLCHAILLYSSQFKNTGAPFTNPSNYASKEGNKLLGVEFSINLSNFEPNLLQGLLLQF